MVDETARDYPASVNVWLLHPFRVAMDELPAHVTFQRVDDPHYWLAEYFCTKHNHVLACKFDGTISALRDVAIPPRRGG